MVVDYHQLKSLAEEVGFLKGAQLQDVFVTGAHQAALIFRHVHQNWAVIFDMTPAFPWVVRLDAHQTKKKKSEWGPVLFIRAHLKSSRLEEVVISPEPDRRIGMRFTDGTDDSVLVFDCFPHGSRMQVWSHGKYFSFPASEEGDSGLFRWDQALVAEPSRSNEVSQYVHGFKKSANTISQPAPSATHEGLALAHSQKFLKQKGKLLKAMEGIQRSLDNEDDEVKLLKWGERIKLNPPARESLSKEFPKWFKGGESTGRVLEILFSEAKRARRKREMNAQRLEEFREQLARLEAQVDEIVAAPLQSNELILPPSKHKKESPFSGLRVKVREGWELWVGRNSSQNEELLKLAGPHDAWMHLRDYPGAHGILRGPSKKEPLPQDLDFSCCVIAQLSRTKKNGFQAGEQLDFYCVPRKFIKKPKGLGQGKVIVERETVRRVRFNPVSFEMISTLTP